MELFLDIETVPCQRADIREELARSIKAPATYKKPESIAEWEEKEKPKAVEEAWLKTSFDGALGRIVCIGWAVNDSAVQSLAGDDEAEMLAEFFELNRTTRAPRLVGHNITQFDIPFIWKRCIVNNVKPPMWFPRNPKPWSDRVYDTMAQWDGKNNISMDKLARALGLPTKTGSGADVWPMYQEGRIADIRAYCETDVAVNRSIFQRMEFV